MALGHCLFLAAGKSQGSVELGCCHEALLSAPLSILGRGERTNITQPSLEAFWGMWRFWQVFHEFIFVNSMKTIGNGVLVLSEDLNNQYYLLRRASSLGRI
jgi:hypothetical protein